MNDISDRATARYEKALERRGTVDLRPACRQLLKRLSKVDEREYEEAVRRYREELLPAIAGGGEDPVEAWIRYGRWLADRLTPGRLVAVDATGRAHWLSGEGKKRAPSGAGPERGAGGEGAGESAGARGRGGNGEPPADAMLLHFPEDRKRKALLLSLPDEPSEHQAAARELLCQ